MCHFHLARTQQHACLPYGSHFPASAICKQHGRLTRSTSVTACSACAACDAVNSSQCMPKINHPSRQAATRPFFTSCKPAINNAFCECIVHCHLSRAPTCMHDSQVRVSRRLAYSGPRLRSSPHSPLRRRPQMHGTHRCCSLAIFLHCSSRAACLLLDTGTRRAYVPTSSQPLAPQRHARQFNPRPHRSAPSDASV